MSKLIFNLFTKIFFVFLFLKQGDLFKLPNLSQNGTDNQNLGIVNGQLAEDSQFPFTVFIRAFANDEKTISFDCTGIILNKQFILTAAHCVMNRNIKDLHLVKDYRIFTGIVDKSNLDYSKAHHVTQVLVNKDFVYDFSKGFAYDDIALLRLKWPLEFDSPNVKSACLDYSENKKYDHMIAIGFGQTKGDARNVRDHVMSPGSLSKELRFTYLKESKTCPTKYVICTDVGENGENTCQGDSGGPLLNPQHRVIGITSSGDVVRDPSTFAYLYCVSKAYFTRLSKQDGFINRIVGENQYCWYNDD